MIVALFIFLVLVLPALYCLYLVYRITMLYRKGPAPRSALMIFQIIVTAFFLLYHFHLLPDKRLLIVGEFVTNPTDYGHGIANLGVWAVNYLVSLGLFILTQVIFWVILRRDTRKKRLQQQGDKDLRELGTPSAED